VAHAPASRASARAGGAHLLLSYHAVSSTWPSPLAIPERALEEQLRLMRARGYEGFTFAAWERRRSEGTLPPRSVVVTFDDGFASTLRAKPILDAVGYPASVYAVLSFVESGRELAWPGIEQWRDGPHRPELEPLGWEELEGLAASGWEIGSHTVEHPSLPSLSCAELDRELAVSRDRLAARLGSCETIAYPYGAADERVAAAAARAGYLAGCTLTRFQLVDEPYRRPRIGLFASDTGRRLRLKLSAAARRARRSPLLARVVGGD
jgi:peptidoglycan/xylan/chitin deacetylase (PgdA/CDA1 family)